MSEPRILDAEIIDSWYTASDERECEWWQEIEILLDQIAEDPSLRLKVRFLRRDLRWLRHEAWKRQFPWGKEKPRWTMKNLLRITSNATKSTETRVV